MLWRVAGASSSSSSSSWPGAVAMAVGSGSASAAGLGARSCAVVLWICEPYVIGRPIMPPPIRQWQWQWSTMSQSWWRRYCWAYCWLLPPSHEPPPLPSHPQRGRRTPPPPAASVLPICLTWPALPGRSKCSSKIDIFSFCRAAPSMVPPTTPAPTVSFQFRKLFFYTPLSLKINWALK